MNIHNLNDYDLIKQYLGGQSSSLEILISRHKNKVYSYILMIVKGRELAEDIFQDTFIKAYQNLQGFNGKYKFSSWIYRIAHNEAMNAVKKMRHITDDDINELPDVTYSQGIEELMDEEALRGRVRACLNGLEPKYREVIQLVYFERMKYEEVSDILHVPASTIGVWLSRAKKLLKEICQQKGVRR